MKDFSAPEGKNSKNSLSYLQRARVPSLGEIHMWEYVMPEANVIVFA